MTHFAGVLKIWAPVNLSKGDSVGDNQHLLGKIKTAQHLFDQLLKNPADVERCEQKNVPNLLQ